METSLENIVSLRKKLTEVAIEPFGFSGYIDSTSKNSEKLLSNIPKDYLRECYYTETFQDVDIRQIELNKRICIKIDLSNTPNYYRTIQEFLKDNKIRLKHLIFYIDEINYFENKSDKNNHIESYKINLKIIKLLTSVANYKKEGAGNLELFFYSSEQGATLPIQYQWDEIPNNLLEFQDKAIKLQTELTQQEENHEERQQIFINELISVLRKQGASYSILLRNLEVLIDNYEKSFKLYLSGFSFEKIKTASMEYFHEQTDRINSSILKFSTYMLGIPIGYILIIRLLDFSANSLLKDTCLTLLAIVFFFLIKIVLFNNIQDAFSSIDNGISSFINRLDNNDNLNEIRQELQKQKEEIIPKQKKRLFHVRTLTVLILIATILVYISIYHRQLQDQINTLFHELFQTLKKIWLTIRN